MDSNLCKNISVIPEMTLSTNDLNHILTHTLSLWENLRNNRIFITGGTGFFGCWLLESFIWANKKLNLDAHATILTRNYVAFAKKCPHLINKNELSFLEGDVRDFIFPNEEYSYIIHAATDACVTLNESNPNLMMDTITKGTEHVLEFAVHCKTKKFLFVSSGAVYGKQPSTLFGLNEEHSINSESSSAYVIGKRKSEKMCTDFSEKYNLNIKIARCFAFVGPYLPLNKHFAIGNFISNGLNKEHIVIQGDGTPYRSYLYAADLTIWLWTILMRGKSLYPYNVGSDEAISIKETAYLVAKNFNSISEIKIMKTPDKNILPERYVPDISRARNELSLAPFTSLVDAIVLTKCWYENHEINQYRDPML